MKAKILAYSIATGLVLVVVATLLMRGALFRASPEQQRRLAEIGQLDVASFDAENDEVARLVRAIPLDGTNEVDPQLLIGESSLPDRVEFQLRESIAELLTCYGLNDPARLVAFMSARGESVPEAAQAGLRAEISKLNPDAVAISQENLFVEAWNRLGCNPNWQGLLAGESKLVVWRCESAQAFNEIEPHTGDKKVFKNVTNYRHLFAGPYDLRDEAKRKGKIIVADVQFVIEHKPERGNERAMYFTRFWWDSLNNVWRPRLFRFVGTDQTQQGTPPKLLF